MTKRDIETTSPTSADGTTNDANTENNLSCSSAKKLRLSFESDKKECDNYYILRGGSRLSHRSHMRQSTFSCTTIFLVTWKVFLICTSSNQL